jgi:hypothetical protein
MSVLWNNKHGSLLPYYYVACSLPLIPLGQSWSVLWNNKHRSLLPFYYKPHNSRVVMTHVYYSREQIMTAPGESMEENKPHNSMVEKTHVFYPREQNVTIPGESMVNMGHYCTILLCGLFSSIDSPGAVMVCSLE